MPGILHYLRSFRQAAAPGDSDGLLLQRFRMQRDEQAFTTLVQRHGPLVLGIIRRLLGTGDLTDDVFQATFLVLARKGRNMEHWPSVAGWLVQVARRTALQARAKAARRTRHEQQAASMTNTTTDPAESVDHEALAQMLDAELARLPNKYRTPLILCHLQGQSREEAAEQLGWPLGSVAGRLARAKKLLQERLVRRGVVPSLVVGFFALPRVEAQVPGLLVQATTLLATNVVHHAGTMSTSTAVTLAQGVMTSMMMNHVLKLAAVVVLCVGLGLGGAAWAWPGHGQQGDAQTNTTDSAAKQNSPIEPVKTTDYDRLAGVWRREERHPVTNELTAIEELVFRNNFYIRRKYSLPGGITAGGAPGYKYQESSVQKFELHESLSPRGIDLDIRDENSYRTSQPMLFQDTSKLSQRVLIERQLGIYQLSDNEFKYVITGRVPHQVNGDHLVPNTKSPDAVRATSFEQAKGTVLVYKRFAKALKDEVTSNAPVKNTKPPATPASGSLFEQIQGHWIVEKSNDTILALVSTIIPRGNLAPPTRLSQLTHWKFDKNRLYLSTSWSGLAGEASEVSNRMGTFYVDESKTPAQFNTGGLMGIIKLQDGKLQVCMAFPNINPLPSESGLKDSRPKAFEGGEQVWLVTLRRANDYDLIEGVWRKEERNAVTNELISAEELIFKKDQYVRRSTKALGQWSEQRPQQFRLDSQKSPKHLDLSITSVTDLRDVLIRAGFTTGSNVRLPLGFLKTELDRGDLAERTLAIYELSDRHLKYALTGKIPFMLVDNSFVPNLKSEFNKRADSFAGLEATTHTYQRVEKSLKENTPPNWNSAPSTPTLGDALDGSSASEQRAMPPRVRSLQEERLKLAKEQMDLAVKAYHAGKFNYAEFGELSQRIVEASLALATDTPSRIKIMEEHLQLLKELEKTSDAKYRAGTATSYERNSNQLRRIEMEIQIEELKSKGKP